MTKQSFKQYCYFLLQSSVSLIVLLLLGSLLVAKGQRFGLYYYFLSNYFLLYPYNERRKMQKQLKPREAAQRLRRTQVKMTRRKQDSDLLNRLAIEFLTGCLDLLIAPIYFLQNYFKDDGMDDPLS